MLWSKISCGSCAQLCWEGDTTALEDGRRLCADCLLEWHRWQDDGGAVSSQWEACEEHWDDAAPCQHTWQYLQTIPGSGTRCTECGLTEPD